jgi:subtilisin family serine protease
MNLLLQGSKTDLSTGKLLLLLAMNKAAILSFILLVSFNICSQPAATRKYWVSLKDKNGVTVQASASVSQKSANRRNMYHIPFDVTDLPVSPSYISQIGTVPGVKILYASKWLNGLVVAIDTAMIPGALSATNNFSFVISTRKVQRYRSVDRFTPPYTAQQRSSSVALSKRYDYGGSASQVTQMNTECLHYNGYRGQGMTIAVCDVGFNGVDGSIVFDSLRNNGGIKGTYDFVNGNPNVYNGGDHGTMVLSCMAANLPGKALGTAPMADYWLFRTEEGSSETLSEEFNWIRAAEYADSIGADIITTSLGYTEFDDPSQNHTYSDLNGRTAPMSIAATMAARKGMFIAVAAGNEGANSWHYISVPGDADSICTVGAVDAAGKYAAFSSVGPTPDNRIKPDLVACGSGAWVCMANSACFPGNGTSFATPLLAGAVACFWQANRSYSNMQVLQALKKTATNAEFPNNTIGWGIPQMCSHEFDFSAYSTPSSEVVVILINRQVYDFISVEVTDLLGHVLLREDVSKNASEVRFDGSSLASAIYLVRVKTSNGAGVKKMLKQ